MIYCPSCGTANRDGSRFCNECGTKLPTMTSSLCPTCGTPNPPHSLFCEKCGTRLIASLAEEPAEPETPSPAAFVPKGLSLPTKSPAEVQPTASTPIPAEPQKSAEPPPSAEEEPPDWMQVVQSAVADTSESDIAKVTAASDATEQAAPEEIPAWLSDLGLTGKSGPLKKSPTDELLPEWAQRLRTMPEAAQPSADEEEEVPDWLKTLGTTGQLPPTTETPENVAEGEPSTATGPAAPAALPVSQEEELPEWLKEPTTPYFSSEIETPPPPPAAPAQPAAEEMPDWLRDLRPASPTEDALPDWLDELGVEEQPSGSTALSTGDSALDWLSQLGATAPETAPVSEPTPEPTVAPDWMSSLRMAEPEVDTKPTEEVPDWLREVEAQQPPLEPTAAAETPDWMSSLRAAPGEPEVAAHEEEQPQEPAAPQKPITDWLSTLRQATPSIDEQPTEEVPEWLESSEAAPQALGGVPSRDQEVPDLLREASTEALPPTTAAEEEIPEWLRAAQPPVESAEARVEEEIPAWLKGIGTAAAGAAAAGSLAEKQEPTEAPAEKPVTDWLSTLRQAAPSVDEQPTEEEPEWLQESAEAAPQAIGGPQAYEQEVPDWLREVGVVQQPTAPTTEEEIPEWLGEAQPPVESTETQLPARPEEEAPDWLKGLGMAAAGAAAGAMAEERKPEEAAPEKPATDWLSALRRATPEIEAEQAAEEAQPEWLQESAEAAPQAIGGPQAYNQEVPDWLRETPPSPERGEEENLPDWLREESGAVAQPTQPPVGSTKEEEGVPDWLKGLGAAAAVASRAEEPSEEGLPDWLREEAAPPAPALTFETPPAEEAAPGVTPEWLHELTPTATTEAEPEAGGIQEIEQPQEPTEVEPETEGGPSKAATAAVAGLAAVAAAGAVKKPEQAEAAPAELPEWLKEIRQEQQTARTAIPVPPPEATGLTQAEIPAWLEALRPKEEAAAPKEAETPSETEGPLAGIANVLPSAPIMGEMHGLAAKLQFAISAEDQARAGVLKELLTQHAVAPASVGQFVVKGSAVRRRALRWLVTFLIAIALVVPIGFDINQRTGLKLMPDALNMVVPAANQLAAVEIAKLAQLPARAKVLVVFDYDALQAGEMNRVAQALLRSPALRNVDLAVTSLNPQGGALAQTVMQSVPELAYTNLGFVPGQVNGVQSLVAKSSEVNLIIDLAASSDTVRWWAEQLKASRSAASLVAGVSAGAESLTMPYLQSGQVKGLVSGYSGAVAYLNMIKAISSTDQPAQYQLPLEGLTLANYVMVALIVVGLIAALLRGTGRRSA